MSGCYCGGVLEPCQDSVEPNVTRLRCSRPQCIPPRRRQGQEEVRKLVREEALLSAGLAQREEEDDPSGRI